ncbi:MAG: hypothetical protein IJW23_08460 [Lentisphaeria bacterium]|nr:hypothetical protein [Lentisphaeria bacterium]
MSEQTEKIIEKFQTIIRNDLAALEFWQEFDHGETQEPATALDDLIAEIPENLSSNEDFERLRDFALKTMELCRKKKELLSGISGELSGLDGI